METLHYSVTTKVETIQLLYPEYCHLHIQVQMYMYMFAPFFFYKSSFMMLLYSWLY